jgi:hypothetical protein
VLVVVVLAGLGGWLGLGLLQAERAPRVGRAIGTAYGAFTVTRVSTTFVPDTQGPPTVAQHSGQNGSNQLQVWLRWENRKAPGGIRVDPGSVRFVPRGGSAVRPAGSTLTAEVLAIGAQLDGQVWFDLSRQDPAAVGRGVIEVHDPAAGVILIPITPAPATPTEHGTHP